MLLSGWLPFLVYCNTSLIASFYTDRQQKAFIAERKAKYPRNHYGDRPVGGY